MRKDSVETGKSEEQTRARYMEEQRRTAGVGSTTQRWARVGEVPAMWREEPERGCKGES